MSSKRLIAVGVVLAVLAVVVWAGTAGGTGSASRQWEYGVFVGEPAWSWYGPTAEVSHGSPQEFARAMNAAYSTEGAAFETSVLNALGAQGWELVTAPERSKYVFRRPR
jgi:hypothetical protein